MARRRYNTLNLMSNKEIGEDTCQIEWTNAIVKFTDDIKNRRECVSFLVIVYTNRAILLHNAFNGLYKILYVESLKYYLLDNKTVTNY